MLANSFCKDMFIDLPVVSPAIIVSKVEEWMSLPTCILHYSKDYQSGSTLMSYNWTRYHTIMRKLFPVRGPKLAIVISKTDGLHGHYG